MSHSQLKMLWFGLGLVIAAGGCQGRSEFTFAAVEGTVTKGGRPLAEVEVIFFPDGSAGAEGPRASGLTDKEGHYRLEGDLIRGAPSPAEGAVVGKQRVCLIDSQAEPSTPKEKRRVPANYESFNETPLRAEVHPGAQVIDLEVK